jgi:hypothetical protein
MPARIGLVCELTVKKGKEWRQLSFQLGEVRTGITVLKY